LNRAANITIAIVMWLAIAAYVVAAARYGHQRRAEVTVAALKIAIVDTAGMRVVTPEKIQGWLSAARIEAIGRPIDSVDTRAIETRLAARAEVKHVSAWTDLGGNLTVRVEPRRPAFRVRTAGGYRFWYTEDGYLMRDRDDFAAYVPVVTGRIPFPFGPTVEGSYAEIKAAAWNDFLARFTALDAERRELEARSAGLRAQIRSIRESAPKRWWSQSRRKTFIEGKAARIATLETERRETGSGLRKIAGLKHELREKEKKSQQSLAFLSKLANFVGYIGTSDFWSSQIVQINVRGEDSNASGDGVWSEPLVELIPRAGDHIVMLGELDGTERERLENLRLFYLRGLWHEGWETFTGVDIRYRNQIVCTK
jgi:cell division protein FtsQ